MSVKSIKEQARRLLNDMEEDFQTEKERYSEYPEDEVNFMTSWLTAIKEFNNFINTVPIVTKKRNA